MRRTESELLSLCRVIALALTCVGLLFVLRIILVMLYSDALSDLPTMDLVRLFWVGLRLDGVVIGYLLLPACALLALPFARSRRTLHLYAQTLLAIVALDAAAELAFFRFYGFRPNHLVLDHGADAEVLRSALSGWIGPLLAVPILFLLLRRVWAMATTRIDRALSETVLGKSAITSTLATVYLIGLSVLAARGSLDHRALNPSLAALTANRVANEIAGNGMLNLGHTAAQRWKNTSPDLEDLHTLLPDEEAKARVRRLLAGKDPFTDDSVNPYVRRVDARAREGRPLSVVLVVMESFSGRLVGALGGSPALSPELDDLAREGVLFTRCYAAGERTVQGLEATVSSFPPLPGVSVVRRPEAQHGFTTLASLLREQGYDTLFLYGGQGIFDHMRGFFLGNGFTTFIEERDFDDVRFRGYWGVSDEDLFRRANRELQARWDAGKPFFATLLTVSLHAPWEFPRDRAPVLPPQTQAPQGFAREELANFLYADFAVGEFIREARRLPYARDTLFVFVGDHGVHLRGRALLPSEEYRVPALFLAPGLLEPRRVDAVTSQLDIAPTILGLLGQDFRTPFFGRDVLASPASEGFALLVYNKRDYGVRRADRLTVLPAGGRRTAYRVTGEGNVHSTALSTSHEEDARDALAVLQEAQELLRSRRFMVEPTDQPALAARGH